MKKKNLTLLAASLFLGTGLWAAPMETQARDYDSRDFTDFKTIAKGVPTPAYQTKRFSGWFLQVVRWNNFTLSRWGFRGDDGEGEFNQRYFVYSSQSNLSCSIDDGTANYIGPEIINAKNLLTIFDRVSSHKLTPQNTLLMEASDKYSFVLICHEGNYKLPSIDEAAGWPLSKYLSETYSATPSEEDIKKSKDAYMGIAHDQVALGWLYDFVSNNVPEGTYEYSLDKAAKGYPRFQTFSTDMDKFVKNYFAIRP